MARKHALRNWSSSKSWLNCDLYIKYKLEAEAQGLDWGGTSAAAERGTLMHDISEVAVITLTANGRSSGWSAYEIEGEVEEAWATLAQEDGRPKLKPEDIEHIVLMVTEVLGVLERAGEGAQIICEPAVALPHEPESDGYIDVLILGGGELVDHLWVVDYKYGRGAVQPDATQLKGYAASALAWLLDAHDIRVKHIHQGIAQPAVRDTISWFDTTDEETIAFMNHVFDVQDHQEAGFNLRPAADPSVCEWCPAAKLKMCKANTTMMVDMATSLAGAASGKLPKDKVEYLVKNQSAFSAFMKDLKQEIIDDEEGYPDWQRSQVRNPLGWNKALGEEVLAATFAEAGIDPYVIGSPTLVKKTNEGHDKLIESLCAEPNTHTRLAYKPKAEGDK